MIGLSGALGGGSVKNFHCCILSMKFVFSHAQDPQLSSITVLAMDPLTMPSSRAFAKGPLFMAVVMNYLLVWLVPLFQYFSNVSTPAASARDLMEFTVGPAGERKRGYYKRMVETTSSPESYSPELWERVWKASVEWTNLEAGDTALAEWR